MLPLALWVAACRATVPYERLELDGGALLGARLQPRDWENSSVPLLRLDGALRPWSWPVGVRASTSLSGYAFDQTGEQSADLGLGLARAFELVPERLAAALGIGRLFLWTENGDLLANEDDSWQASYLEGGLYVTVAPSEALSLGLEARYSTGDGPELGAESLEGDFLDLYLVFRMGGAGTPASR